MVKKSQSRQERDLARQELAALEQAVLTLAHNFNDVNIHGFVNCILKGWIKSGEFTTEYKQLIEQTHIEQARLREEELAKEYEQTLEAASARAATAPGLDEVIIDTSRWSIR
jgi:hypothetical protein